MDTTLPALYHHTPIISLVLNISLKYSSPRKQTRAGQRRLQYNFTILKTNPRTNSARAVLIGNLGMETNPRRSQTKLEQNPRNPITKCSSASQRPSGRLGRLWLTATDSSSAEKLIPDWTSFMNACPCRERTETGERVWRQQ